MVEQLSKVSVNLNSAHFNINVNTFILANTMYTFNYYKYVKTSESQIKKNKS